MRITFASRLALPILGLVALPALCAIGQAQTIVSPPAAAPGTVAIVPAGPTRGAMPVIVAAAIDTTGNADNAKKALRAANAALSLTPGYSAASAKSYEALAGASMKDADWSFPFTATDYQKIGKVSKAARVMTISVTPGADGSFSAVAEMSDTATGGLTGYGTGASNAPEGGPQSALELAVRTAVVALGETAKLNGIVISRPDGYTARVSLGTLSGARGGARVEYLGETGETIARGTIIDIAAGEALATFAPETAVNDIFVNQRIRLVNNPSEKRALPTVSQLQEKDYKSFERNFGFSLALAGAVYYLSARN